jgi:hypothetical protein
MIDHLDVRDTPNWYNVNQGYSPNVALYKVIPAMFDKDEYLLFSRDEYAEYLYENRYKLPKEARVLVIAEKDKTHAYRNLDSIRAPRGWSMSSIGIGITFETNRSHAITGFVCKNKKYIYDSNAKAVKEIGAFDTDLIAKEENEFYDGIKKVVDVYYYYLCFVRDD